jgi:hypothetical protein
VWLALTGADVPPAAIPHMMQRKMPPKQMTAVEGQSRALWMSTIAFTVCFAVWTIFAIIGVQIKKDLGLNETEFGLLVFPDLGLDLS